ncbi:MAG TPA: ornithine--oxo-acid transaminase [Casimicrobiaceae bacterium]|nr:ornithine--oxo-acid transaminase [Casimicrobiaceae bacterium]
MANRGNDDLRGSRVGRDPASQPLSIAALDLISREKTFGARNYDPLPVVLARGQGSWLADVDGNRYLDLMSAYSAVSFGHAHPRIVAALIAQAQQLGVTSRAYHNDELPFLLERLAQLTGLDRALPANGGAEAVETAIKAARKWGYRIKGIAEGRAEIIGCHGNFHGRTITVTGLSTEPQYRDGFGPFPPGLLTIPYGDADALAKAITPRTAAFLVEAIQGEGGIVVPAPGYLARCRQICRDHHVLMICDEIQTGLGRTGRFLASEYEGIRPDGVILGKALGGGLLPVSAFVATDDVMQVFHPGDHGSTFGGNPLAAAVAMASLDVLFEEKLIERSASLGAWLLSELQDLRSHIVCDVRGVGLFIGIEVDARYTTARPVVDRLLARGILSKDTHGTVVRIAPPLNIPRDDLEWAIGEIRSVFRELERDLKRAA